MSDLVNSGVRRPFTRRTFLAGASGAAAAVALGPPRWAGAAPPAGDSYISTRPGRGFFPLVAHGRAAPLIVSAGDFPGVVRVVNDLQADIKSVTGVEPAVSGEVAGDAVIVGTIGTPLIDRLVSAGKLDVSGIAGKWETSLEQVVDDPLSGVRRAFVIAGSDQRGTIFGAYDVSRNIGVSPWYWWDDVPAEQHDALYVRPGRHTQGTPAVKYRGLFINDENPDLGRWAPWFFGPGLAPGFPGGFNHEFYAKVFELMLRLKANYLWPAVWGRAFAEDDPANHATATAYGIVMGTSHEAPMLRGIEEWNRHAVAAVRDSDGNIVKPGHDPYGGTGEWSFRHNADAIKAYWRDGIQRMVDQDIEGVVTIGMRGNGDVSLPDGDGIDLMESIISTERTILAEAGMTDAPQVWTLYKEVQRYWDKGLRPPDDVMVVLTDDNWGNMRKFPDEAHPGGYGIYYHFDYVGGGRDYKWVDTSQLANTWEQLDQCYQHGISSLWVANVGDMKGNELPLQFFLDYAWDPDRWPLERLGDWLREYAAENFGARHAAELGEILDEYGNLQALRKPELLNRRISVDPTKDIRTDASAVVYDDRASTFSLTDYRELEQVTERWQRLSGRAQKIGRRLPNAYQDAYYEVVLYNVQATANVYALRLAEFTNIRYAGQGRAATNGLADVAEARLADDFAMMDRFSTDIAGGKWKSFQSQPHIDYGDVARYGPNAPWQQPELNNDAIPDVIFPAVQRIQLVSGAQMGVAIDGSDAWWPDSRSAAVLPAFSPYQSQPAQFIDVFNRGDQPFTYHIRAAEHWVKVEPAGGRVDKEVRASVRVDWSRAPSGTHQVPITITGPGGASVHVQAVVENPEGRVHGFVEANGCVAMDAAHYTRAVPVGSVGWRRIPGIGRTDAGMQPVPVTAPSQQPGAGPRLEYAMTLLTTGPVTVWAYLSPRTNTLPTPGLRYAISIDDAPPQVVDVVAATGADSTGMNRQWERNTSDNVNRTATTHPIAAPGPHVLKFWMIDPTVVLQKLVIDTGTAKISYLGPPESLRASHGGLR